jgi:allantoate deiminase
MDERVLAAIREYGLDPARIPEAALDAEVKAYFEFHIEQGPVLESLGLSLGVVEAIAGLSRWEIRFEGKANHAGTTPMSLRRDALACAAEWIGLVEHVAQTTPGLVATVGTIEAQPGAANVIPGVANASLDVRHASDEVRERALKLLLDSAEHIAHGRGLTVTGEPRLDQPAVALHLEMVEEAVESAGFPVHRMVSGAGHDAMILARKIPASMLFLRSPGGISHHPDESVLAEDVDAAMAVGAELLEGRSRLMKTVMAGWPATNILREKDGAGGTCPVGGQALPSSLSTRWAKSAMRASRSASSVSISSDQVMKRDSWRAPPLRIPACVANRKSM